MGIPGIGQVLSVPARVTLELRLDGAVDPSQQWELEMALWGPRGTASEPTLSSLHGLEKDG